MSESPSSGRREKASVLGQAKRKHCRRRKIYLPKGVLRSNRPGRPQFNYVRNNEWRKFSCMEANNSNPHHDIDGHRHDLWCHFVYVNKEDASRDAPSF